MGIESSKTCYIVVKVITEHTSFLVARNCWFDMNFSEKDMIVPMNSLCININYSLESLREKNQEYILQITQTSYVSDTL